MKYQVTPITGVASVVLHPSKVRQPEHAPFAERLMIRHTARYTVIQLHSAAVLIASVIFSSKQEITPRSSGELSWKRDKPTAHASRIDEANFLGFFLCFGREAMRTGRELPGIGLDGGAATHLCHCPICVKSV